MDDKQRQSTPKFTRQADGSFLFEILRSQYPGVPDAGLIDEWPDQTVCSPPATSALQYRPGIGFSWFKTPANEVRLRAVMPEWVIAYAEALDDTLDYALAHIAWHTFKSAVARLGRE